MIKKIAKLLRPLWRFRFYFLVAVLTIPAVASLLQPGYFPHHDDLQVLRLQQIDKCFKDGQLPCRFVPDPGFGYGYPMFNYYPPLPYYVAEGFYLLGVDIFWSIKLTFVLSFILSGLFMYLLVGSLFGTLPGLVAAVFYVWAPYHSVDVYVRGAMNESWGLTFFPVILYFCYRLARADKSKWLVPALAASYAALLLSHNVMTLLFSPILALWSLGWLFYFKTWKQIKALLIGGLWGVALAAFFFLPVTLEKDLVHVETMTIGYFNYLAHYADIKQLLFSRYWGYGGSTWGPEDSLALPIGQFHWILACLTLAISLVMAVLANRRHKLKLQAWPKVIFWIWFFVGTGILYAFLTHSRSVWFWDHLPLLYYAQFPWRLLAIPTLTFSIVGGVFISLLPKGKLRLLISLALVVGVIAWNYPFFRIEKPLSITAEEKFSGNLWELQVTGGIFDYLPKTASRPPGGPAFTYPQYLSGNGGIRDFKRGTNWLKFTAVVSSQAKLQLPLFEFPRTVVTLDGKRIEFGHDSDLGRLEIQIPPGEHQIEARIEDTPIRTLANIISLVALGLLIKRMVRRD